MAEKKKPATTKLSRKEYEDLGRIVASVYESGYLDKATAYRTYFIKGILQGFGGVIGATILVAVLLGVLSFFGRIPFLDSIVQQIQATIEQQPQ